MGLRLIREQAQKVICGDGENLLADPHLEVRVARIGIKRPDGTFEELPPGVACVELEFFAPPTVRIVRYEAVLRANYERLERLARDAKNFTQRMHPTKRAA